MTTTSIAPLLSAAMFLVLGFFVLLRNKKSKINLTFFLVCVCTTWWQMNWFFLFNTQNAALADFLVRLGYLGIIFIPITFLHFFLVFLGNIGKFDKIFLRVAYFFGIIFAFFLFFSNFFINGYYIYYWGFYPKAGVLHPLYLLLLSLCAFRIIVLSFRTIRKRGRIEPFKYYQTKYLLWGLILYVFAGTDFLVNYGFEFYPLGFLFILVFSAIVAYTIIKYRLMDIRLIVKRSTVFSLLVLFIVGIYVFFLNIWSEFIREIDFFSGLSAERFNVIMGIFMAVLIVISYEPLKKQIEKITEDLLFKKQYDPQEVISDVGSKISSTLEIKMVMDEIIRILDGAFHPAGIFVYQLDQSGNYRAVNCGQRKGCLDLKLRQKNGLTDFIRKYREIVVLEEFKRRYESLESRSLRLDIKELDGKSLGIVVPLISKNKLIGMLMLGGKKSGDVYSQQDLDILEVIGSQLAVALVNAFLYEEQKNFNVKLKREVEKATANLRHANQELKKLDKVKSEFISIASHQLRTPLTVIKGYISMMLEGSFGTLNHEEQKSLVKVYESNERLINLVEDLLNISRIESGRLEFDFQGSNMEELVGSVVEELRSAAERKKIYFDFKYQRSKKYRVRADNDKLRQVVMNLMDNAIKYTNKGGVTIVLNMDAKNITFSVSDTGMGMGKDDIKNLFKKFSRGKGVAAVHTEGTGLGLYVAKEIVAAHGGRIWAESAGEGRGSTFFFNLPVFK